MNLGLRQGKVFLPEFPAAASLKEAEHPGKYTKNKKI